MEALSLGAVSKHKGHPHPLPCRHWYSPSPIYSPSHLTLAANLRPSGLELPILLTAALAAPLGDVEICEWVLESGPWAQIQFE